MNAQGGSIRGIICVIGGALIHLSFGYFYTVGNMSPYIIDYMKDRNISVEHTHAVWLTTFALTFEAVGMPLGGTLAKMMPSKSVILISCILHSGSIALTSLTMQWNFIAVLLSYGVLQGFAFGFGYAVIIAVSAMWFPKRRALVVGITVGGFGAGALVFTPIQTAYINPMNRPVNPVTKMYDDPDLLKRVPMACIVMSIMLISIEILGLMMMKEHKSQQLQCLEEIEHLDSEDPVLPKSEQSQGSSTFSNLEDVNVKGVCNRRKLMTLAHTESSKAVKTTRERVSLGQTTIIDLPPSEAIRYTDFYIIWFATAFASIPITLVTSLYKHLLQYNAQSPSQSGDKAYTQQLLPLRLLGAGCSTMGIIIEDGNTITHSLTQSSPCRVAHETLTTALHSPRSAAASAAVCTLVGIEYIDDDRFLAIVSMVASLCNSGGRVIWGLICDRFSFKAPMCTMLTVWAALLITFPHITAFAGSSVKAVYLLWVASLYFCFCGVFIFVPTAAEIMFGTANLAVNFGLVYNSLIAGSFAASLLNSTPALSGKTSYAFAIGGAMSAMSLLTVIWITDRNMPACCSILRIPNRIRKRCGGRKERRASNGSLGMLLNTEQTSTDVV